MTGGNRKLWTKENTGLDLEITAVEIDENIAKIYKDFFPDDIVIVGDAHQYLLEHFKEYDFIWSSPPCQSHSVARYWSSKSRNNKYNYPPPIYPDMKLYEEIIFLKHFSKTKYCIENVISYYEPLVKPTRHDNHYFWTNYIFENSLKRTDRKVWRSRINELQKITTFDLSNYKKIKKQKLLRNCVKPTTGLYIFNCAFYSNVLFKT